MQPQHSHVSAAIDIAAIVLAPGGAESASALAARRMHRLQGRKAAADLRD